MKLLSNYLRGGVRCIMQLRLLLELERKIGLGLQIQAFFDLVIGTRYVLRHSNIEFNTSLIMYIPTVLVGLLL